MVRKLLLLSLFLAAARTSAADPAVADEVATYRAGIVAELRAQLAARGVAAQTRLDASAGRVVVGADKQRILTATVDANGVSMACHEGVENAARAIAAAQGAGHE